MISSERCELRTIMTADLQGFSSRLSTDESTIIRLLVDSYYALAERAVLENGGVLFRKEGDAVWCSFSSARSAVKAAIGIQEGVLVHNLTAEAGSQMHLRVGLHLGEVVITSDEEVLGHTLSVAKRLETACEVGGIHLSQAVYSQVAGLPLSFDFADRGEIELKGVGPTRVYLGRITEERRALLLRERVSAPQQLVLAANLLTLPPLERTPWERRMLQLSRRHEAVWMVGADDTGYLAGPCTPELVRELRTLLPGPRCAVGMGPVAALPRPEGRELYGAAVEEVLKALHQTGFEAQATVLTPAAAALGWDEVEPYGEGLYRLRAPAGRFESRTRRVTGLGEDGLQDVVAGFGSGGERPAALAQALAALDPELGALEPVVAGSGELSQLAAAAALIAAHEELGVPAGALVVGAVRETGALIPPSGPELRRLKAAIRRSPYRPALVVGHPALAGELEIPLVRVENLEDLRSWLRQQGRPGPAEALVRSHAAQRLTLLVAAPAGGHPEAEDLAHRLDEAAGRFLEGSLPQRLEEAEETLGREGLELVYRRWAADLRPCPLVERLAKVRPENVVVLFPDPRLRVEDRLDLAETLLTERDWDVLGSALCHLNRDESQRLSAHDLLLVACQHTEEPLRGLFRQLRARSPAHPGRQSVLVLEGATEVQQRWWARRGVEIVDAPAADLLDSLVSRAGGEPGDRAPRRRGAAPSRPYKFLDYFGPSDRTIFFGRERETEHVYSMLVTGPALVLYGRSGVGKTSLVNAGVLSRFPRPENLALVVRCLADPAALLRSELESLVGPQDTLRALLAASAEVISGRMVVVLDQFEEFFVRLSPSERARFLQEMAELSGRLPDRCHLLFSMREDFLAEMADVESVFPGLLDRRYRLTALTERQARLAINGPAELFGMSVDGSLTDQLMQELFREGVEPPELQIVLDRLYDLRDRERNALTMEAYHELGGVRTILVDYLHATLDRLGEQEVDPRLARHLLKEMVTDRGTKAVLRLGDLVASLEQPIDRVRQALSAFVEARLVRALADDQGSQFELAHEYIIQEVLSWATQEELALRHARQVLRSELDSWRRFGSLMSEERLMLIGRERPSLMLGPEEHGLLVRAAAVHGRPLEEWLEDPRAQSSAIPVLGELLEDPATSGEVARRLLAVLFGLDTPAAVAEAMLRAAERFGNPGLLQSLDPARAPRLFERLRQCTRHRFFGPHRMVRIPGGPCLLGSTRDVRELRKSLLREDQRPAVESEPDLAESFVEEFWIDRYPVTHAEFSELRPSHRYRYPPEHADHPAVFVSWYDAREYAAWLGKRLPTEEEWEKAARGTGGRYFPWGNDFDAARTNSAESGRMQTTAVDAHPEGASPYGCYDMAGNVWEWTESAWKEGAPFKAQKGGSTVSREPHLHSSTRLESFPDFIQQWVGFRTAAGQVPP